MFSQHVNNALVTGDFDLPPQSSFTCPGTAEKSFGEWIEILIHKCLGLSETATYANWSHLTLQRAEKAFEEGLAKLSKDDQSKFSEFKEELARISEYIDAARKSAVGARENVREFLCKLHNHSASRVMDEELQKKNYNNPTHK